MNFKMGRLFPFGLTRLEVVEQAEGNIGEQLPSLRIEHDDTSMRYRLVYASNMWTGRTAVDERPIRISGGRFGRHHDGQFNYNASNLHLEDRLVRITILGRSLDIKLPFLFVEVNPHIPIEQKSHRQWVLWLYGRRVAWHYYIALPTRSIPQ